MILNLKKKRSLKIVCVYLPFVFLWMGCTSRHTVSFSKYSPYLDEVNQHIRLIEGDIRHIFEILTSEPGMATLCPDGISIGYLSPSPYTVGDLIETEVSSLFTFKWKSRVVAVEPNRLIRLKFIDGFFANGLDIWELEEQEAKTRVSHTIIVNPRGFIRKAIWRLKGRKKHDILVERFLDNLQLITETTSKSSY